MIGVFVPPFQLYLIYPLHCFCTRHIVLVITMPKIIHIVLIKAEPSAGDFTQEWKQKGEAMLGGSFTVSFALNGMGKLTANGS